MVTRSVGPMSLVLTPVESGPGPLRLRARSLDQWSQIRPRLFNESRSSYS